MHEDFFLHLMLLAALVICCSYVTTLILVINNTISFNIEFIFIFPCNFGSCFKPFTVQLKSDLRTTKRRLTRVTCTSLNECPGELTLTTLLTEWNEHGYQVKFVNLMRRQILNERRVETLYNCTFNFTFDVHKNLRQ